MSRRFSDTRPEGVTDEGVAQLERLLADRLGALPPIQLRGALGGTNRRTHFLAIDSAAQRFSVKGVSHPNPATPGKPFPAANVHIAGRLSVVLSTPAIIRTAMVGRIPGLGDLSMLEAVGQRWHGDPIDELTEAFRERLRAQPAPFLRQYGEWIAFGLLFCLCDGKPDHWTWQAGDQTLGRTDLECLFHLPGKPSDFIPGLQRMRMTQMVAEAGSVAHGALADGIDTMLRKFTAQRPSVEAVLGDYDHCRDFLHTSQWAAVSTQEMLAAVAEALA